MNEFEQAVKDLKARRGEAFTQATFNFLSFREALSLLAKLVRHDPTLLQVFEAIIQAFSGQASLFADVSGLKVDDMLEEGEALSEVLKKVLDEELLAQAKAHLLIDLDKPSKGFMQ